MNRSKYHEPQKVNFYQSIYLFSQHLALNSKVIQSTIRFINFGKTMWLISILFHIPKIRNVFLNWPEFILDCFGLINKEYVIYETREGMKYKARPKTIDVGILEEVIVSRDYLHSQPLLQKGDVVIDIGAQIGSYSLLLASISKDIKIYAIEPQSDNYKLLCDNITLNNLKNITPLRTAILSTKKNEHFYESESHKGAHTFFPQNTKGFKQIDLQTSTLRHIFQKFNITRVRLLKIDCEGAEYDILFGCPDEILRKIQEIVLEFHPLDDTRNERTLTTFLRMKGFKNISVTPFPTNIMFCKR